MTNLSAKVFSVNVLCFVGVLLWKPVGSLVHRFLPGLVPCNPRADTFQFRELVTGCSMLSWVCDEEVWYEPLPIPGAVKIAIDCSGCGRDEWAEESVRFGVGNDSTVIDDGLESCFNMRVPGPPRIEGETRAHQHLAKSVEWFAQNHLSNKWGTCRRWGEKKPSHCLGELRAGDR